MKASIVLFAGLCAAAPAWAADPFGNLLKQSVNSALQQAANRAINPSTAPAAPAAPVARPDSQPQTQGGAELRQAAQPVASGMPYKAGTYKFDYDLPFYADYIANYWRDPNASTRGDTPSEDAPGVVVTKLVFTGNQKEPGVPEMRRKLEALFPMVLVHPALKDIRGSSLTVGGSFGNELGQQIDPVVVGRLTIGAEPIHLDNPKTIRLKDGTYATYMHDRLPLEISVNDTRVLEGRSPIGTWNGMTVVSRGGGYMLVIPNTDRPLYLAQGSGRSTMYTVNPQLIDASRPKSDIQFMTVYAGAPSHISSAIAHGKEKPTSAIGRLLGTEFTMDWPAVLKEINNK